MRRTCHALVVLIAGAVQLGGERVAAENPIGIDALTQLDRLPELRQGARTYQTSSHDRAGGNADTGNFLYSIGDENVLLDVMGPGCVYRIWMTGIDLGGHIRVYFDGAATPAVDMTLGEFFGGTVPPFLHPLVLTEADSSGGFTCYVPMAFREGCKITTDCGGHYYNAQYQRYADADLTTFTGNENVTEALAAWTSVGSDPSGDQGAIELTQTATVPQGESITLADIDAAGVIQQLEFTLPGMSATAPQLVWDDGRAHRGMSEFTLSIDPSNAGVRLTRRLDYGVSAQKANVYVKSGVTYVLAGEWFTAGGTSATFLDDVFEPDAGLTAGLSALTIRIEFVSSAIDWNEFHYWADSLVDGEWVRTDVMDVGNGADESAHAYAITNATWSGARTYVLYSPADETYTDILTNTRIVATWDNAATPQVNVPLGSLFGSNRGPRLVGGLPVGIVDDRLYCWLPMPFATTANLRLDNNSSHTITDLDYRVSYTPTSRALMDKLGYFHAQSRIEAPCTVGRDFTILDVTGAGHFVGVVQTSTGPGLGYLEGDERVYVDGSLTPALYGTGTEDFYNGGWYFNRGRFSTPTHGNPSMEGSPIATDMYRFLLSDMIPFTTALHVGIEHGAGNETADTTIEATALYYKRDEPLAVLTDELDVGDTSSEAAHDYAYSEQTWEGILTSSYEGDDDDVALSDDGRRHRDQSTFVLNIAPDNAGVLLRRRLDYGLYGQRADVYVDGQPAGTWYDAGRNLTHRFRDSEFMIPASLTSGKSTITIRVQCLTTLGWMEFHYWVYSLLPVPTRVIGDLDCDGSASVFDIDAFVLAILHPADYVTTFPACDHLLADCNGDGAADVFDIDAFVATILRGE